VVVVPDGVVSSSSTSSTSGTRSTVVAPTKSYDGYYLKPVNGKRTQGIHGYNGVDLAAPAGTPILASASGKVIISRNSGWNGGYGRYIVIQHDNGTQTLYAHNSENIVYGGADVVQGQVIAYMGASGKATGAHVHFEIRGAKNPF
jgi:murein DD-endopeptidase MepM/ murein hydrolase activator NlpD